MRKALRFGRDTSIASGNYFVVGGQLAYVAAIGDAFKAPNGEDDARLRVIYANGTESNLLLRSLQRALYKDEPREWFLVPLPAIDEAVRCIRNVADDVSTARLTGVART